MIKLLQGLLRPMGGSARDLAPIFIVIGVFQLLVLRQPLPDVWELLGGVLRVVVGLTLFVQGLNWACFPSARAWPMPSRGRAA